MHVGDSTRTGANRGKTGGNHKGVPGNDENGGGSCFLQKALAIAASSYPSPLNKYEMPTSPQPEVLEGASGTQE